VIAKNIRKLQLEAYSNNLDVLVRLGTITESQADKAYCEFRNYLRGKKNV
jgi:uncharacterized protein YutE (UPF0331/DUF86 family)